MDSTATETETSDSSKVVVNTESPAGESQRTSKRDHFLESVAGKHEKARVIKNVIVVSVAFMLHFTAFHGTANLQSSINSEAGTYSLLSIYGSLMIANIFLPVLVIRYLGLKWTISLAFITYMPFVAAQFYPHAATLIPSGITVGLGGAAMWCAKCTYLTIVAEAFACLDGKASAAQTRQRKVEGSLNQRDQNNSNKSSVLVVRFFGLFFFFYQMAQVWGNLISSTVLSLESSDSDYLANDTQRFADVGLICGANFCPGSATASDNPYLVRPDPGKIDLLSGIFLAFMVTSVLLCAFGLDSAKRYDLGRSGSGGGLMGCDLLMVTVKQLAKKKQLLLIPVTFFVGFDHAIINADLTSAFIACGWGISNIGYAMVCFGIANALGSALAGFLTKIIGRFTVVAVNASLHLALLIWLIRWQPVHDGLSYCLISSIWGAVNGIWLVQINALSGILFRGNEEAAFSNFRFIEAIGSVAAYAISPLLCMYIKLWMMIAIILLGMSGYSLVEYWEVRKRKSRTPMSVVTQHEVRLDSQQSDSQAMTSM